MANHLEGKCAIKAEYLIAVEQPPAAKRAKLDDDAAADDDKNADAAADAAAIDGGDPPKCAANPSKKADKRGGMNKSRKSTVFRLPRAAGLCKAYMDGPRPERACAYDKCKYGHDVPAYLAAKGADIGATCHIYSTRGFCVRGVTCRFAGAHLDADQRNMRNEELWAGGVAWEAETMNAITHGKIHC